MAAPTLLASDAFNLVTKIREVMRTGVLSKFTDHDLERMLAICTQCSSSNQSGTLTDVVYDDALDGRSP